MRRSPRTRRAARRFGLLAAPRVPDPPARPVGVKLELTARCNLRCAFCYTDSPRQTLQHAVDLPDDVWRDIVEQAIEIGVIEAVVTGGEPFLKRALTLELLARLDGAGIGVSLNTNGWFVDEEIADRLAALRGVFVHVSIDGAAPSDHDAARGVPGSWRRAVRAVHLMVERGVPVQVVHVVTPANEHGVPAFLELAWLLGATAARLTPVAPIGGAARSADWGVNRNELISAVSDFQARRGDEMRIRVQNAGIDRITFYESFPPASMLIRPDGIARPDSLTPFAFGNVRRDPLARCWARIANGWKDDHILAWAASARDGALDPGALVPYRDDEAWIGGDSPSDEPRTQERPEPKLPEPAAAVAGAPPSSVEEQASARAHVAGLALSRHYALGEVRWSPGLGGERLVRVHDRRRVVTLNPSAAVVMDACDGGTAADALDALQSHVPSVDQARLEPDLAGALRSLLARGVIRPARAQTAAIPPADMPDPDLPG